MPLRLPRHAGAAPRARALQAAVAVLVTLSCSGSEPTAPSKETPGPAPVALVALSADTATLRPGQTVTLTATPKDAAGTALAGRAVTWTSSDTLVARVTAGTVTGVAGGTATITAAAEGKSAAASVTVRVPVAAVTVTPDSGAAITPGVERTLVAVARDSAGGALAGRTVAWASSDTTVATVTTAGVVRARFDGTATITATAEGKSGAARVQVRSNVAAVAVPDTATLASGAQRTLAAVARDSLGRALPGRAVAWSTTDPDVAVVDTLGRVTGRLLGRATVVAAVEGKSGQTSVVVTPVTVASVAFADAAVTVRLGELRRLGAQAKDSGGAVLADRPLAWRAADTTVVRVDDDGRVVGLQLGGTTVTASAEGKSASVAVTVSAVPAASLDVGPDSAVLLVGDTVTLAAVPRDSAGGVLDGRAVAWTSLTPAVATVTAAGLVKAVSLGTAVVRATGEGRTADAVVRVAPPPTVASISFSRASLAVATGDTAQLHVILRDSVGNVLTQPRAVAWTSSDPLVATAATPTGPGGAWSSATVVYGNNVGSATATVTVGGKSATLPVTVGAPQKVASVRFAVRSATTEVSVEGSVRLDVLDPAGRPIGTRAATWTTSNPAVLELTGPFGAPTNTGPYGFVGKATGTAWVKVQVDALADSVLVTVVPTTVAYLDVLPSPAEVQVGATLQLAALARAINTTPVTTYPTTWTTANPAVATVSAAGVVTGVALGTTTVTASVNDHTRAVTVSVVPVGVAAVALSPSPLNLSVGGTRTLTALVKDGGGATLAGRSVRFASANAAVARVDSLTGAATGVAVGTTTVSATSEGKTGTVTVAVRAPGPVATVTATPSPATVAATRTQALAVTLRDSTGAELTGRTITYASLAPSIATVSAAGVVTGVATGATTVTVTSETKTTSVPVTVTPAPVALARVEVTPTSVAVAVNATVQLTARPIDVTNTLATDRVVTFTSATPGVATVTAAGLVRGVAVGTTTVTVASEGRSVAVPVTVTSGTGAVASVTVSPDPAEVTTDGGTATLAAAPRDAGGALLAGRTVSWTVADTAIVSVSAAGVVTGRKPGTTTVTATSEGKSGSATVVSRPPATIARIAAYIGRAELAVGDTARLVMQALDATGTEIKGVTFTTENLTPSRITLGGGLVTGVAIGPAGVMVRAGGLAFEVNFDVVTSYTILKVNLYPTRYPATMMVDSTAAAAAFVVGARGLPLIGYPVVWTSSNPAVLSVAPLPAVANEPAEASVRALALGTSLLIARAGARSDTLAFTVSDRPVGWRVDISPDGAYLAPGSTQQLTAVAYDRADQPVRGASAPTWATSDASVATVSATGLVTAKATGTATISATIDGVTDRVPVKVQAAVVPVGSVVVTPGRSTLSVGGTVQLAATVRDNTGVMVTGRAVAWSTSNAAIATVSARGLVTARSSGTATITATSEGKSGTATVQVGTTTGGGGTGGSGSCAGRWTVAFGKIPLNAQSGWVRLAGTNLELAVKATGVVYGSTKVHYVVLARNGYGERANLSIALATGSAPTAPSDRVGVSANTSGSLTWFNAEPGNVFVYADQLEVGGRRQCQ